MADMIRFDNATIGGALGATDADDAEPAERLVGHVDCSDDRGISGWLANMDRPERLEPVLCTDGDGGEVVFRTWHVREDVCRFFGIDGRFGFVIPSSSLRGLKAPVTVRDRTGSPLAGGSDLWPPRAAAARGAGPAVVLLHIPKTAGTSVRHALIEGLEPSARLFVYMPPYGLTLDEIVALPLAQRRAARMIVGHMHFGIDRVLGQEARYVTFLREPMARLRSQVAHHQRAGTTFSGPSGPSTLQEAVAEGLDEQFDNLMTRVVAGLPGLLLPLGAVTQDAVELAMLQHREPLRACRTGRDAGRGHADPERRTAVDGGRGEAGERQRGCGLALEIGTDDRLGGAGRAEPVRQAALRACPRAAGRDRVPRGRRA